MNPASRALAIFGVAVLAAFGIVLSAPAAPSQAAGSLDPSFDAFYDLVDLGAPRGVPMPYGGLTLKADDPNILLIGGGANSPSGAIYALPLMRDGSGQIVGFAGPATKFADAPNIDGGLAYMPGTRVLFYTAYPTNSIGQILPGETTPARVNDLLLSGVLPSVGSLIFTPSYSAGAGQLRVLSFNSGILFTVPYSPDGSGTYNFDLAPMGPDLGSGIEGISYVPPGSEGFPQPSVLITNYVTGTVTAYETDAAGLPISATARPFITALSGAEGAYFDTTSGGFLFSTFGGAGSVTIARGFTSPAVAPVITTESLPDGTVDVSYSASISATGEPTPTFEVTEGSLPPGVMFNPTTLQLTGTPSLAGEFTFTITATNSQGNDSARYTVNIAPVPAAPVITTTTLPGGTVGSSYGATVLATGVPTPTFTLTSGEWPGGLSLDAVSGVISGTPTVSGDFRFTLTASNSVGTAEQTFNVAVAAKPTPAPSPTPTPAAGLVKTGADSSQSALVFAGAAALATGLLLVALSKRGSRRKS